MEKNKKNNVGKTLMLVILTSTITFLITYFTVMEKKVNIGDFISEPSKESIGIEKDLRRFKKIIDKHYLGEVDEEKLKESAKKGYIEGLGDPYTEYISKDDMKEYMEETKGNFVGIGIYMVKDEESDKVMVLTPIKNSPAEKAGILPGDLILSVNDEEITSKDISTITDKIKGEIGSKVKIEILREKEIKTFEITREKIIINPVESKTIKNNIGYIQFSSFDEGTAENFKLEFQKLEKQGIKSLIIDLRNNGGGIVSEALKIADFMTEKDSVLLYEVDKEGNEKVEKSKHDPIINLPIVVLTNENTASSSEILAGALKDNGKAKLVGTKTFGKGVIQQILTLPDGSGIKITCEEYLTPNKSKLNKVGIEPNEKVELDEKYKNKLQIEEKDDLQLKRAIEILEEKK